MLLWGDKKIMSLSLKVSYEMVKEIQSRKDITRMYQKDHFLEELK
jgi:hypothetical protein